MITAQTIVLVFLVYFGLGLLFGVCFICWGIRRLDHGTAGAPLGFRLMILPGSAALWPIMLRKWIAAGKVVRS